VKGINRPLAEVILNGYRYTTIPVIERSTVECYRLAAGIFFASGDLCSNKHMNYYTKTANIDVKQSTVLTQLLRK
jgi:hypothetical protein